MGRTNGDRFNLLGKLNLTPFILPYPSRYLHAARGLIEYHG